MELLITEFVECDLQRSFKPTSGYEIGYVARIADAYVLVGLVFHRERGLRPGKLGAELVPLALAFILLGLRCRSRGRSAGEVEGRGGGLHGFVFLAREFEMDVPNLRRTEEILTGRLICPRFLVIHKGVWRCLDLPGNSTGRRRRSMQPIQPGIVGSSQ